LSVVLGAKAAGRFQTFHPAYWQQEVREEKDKRLGYLENIKDFGKEESYSIPDIIKISNWILGSVIGSDYIEYDKADPPAYESLISPGDVIMGDLKAKYRKRLSTKELSSLLDEMRSACRTGEPVKLEESRLDEDIESVVAYIRSTLTDPNLQEEDLRSARYSTISKQWRIGGGAGLLAYLLVFIPLTTRKRNHPE